MSNVSFVLLNLLSLNMYKVSALLVFHFWNTVTCFMCHNQLTWRNSILPI